MHYLLPHSFLLHPNHLVYLSIFALLVIALAAVASILRVFFPKAPYSLLIVSLWSLLLSLCFSADYFRLTPRYFAPLLLIIGTSTLAFSLWQFNRGQSSSSLLLRYRESNSALELLSTICLWILGLFILLIPLAFGFPTDTLITSHFICNDSVVHSILAQGLSYMESRKIDPFYYSAAPRGIHSFSYYFHSLFSQIPTSRIILPTTIASYSLTVLSADLLLCSLGVSGLIRFFAALLPVCAFLPVSAVYAIFLGQSSTAASTFAAIAMAFSLKKFGPLRDGLLFFSLLTLGAITAYGLFSASIIGFGLALSVLLAVLEKPSIKNLKAELRTILSLFRSKLCVVTVLVLLFLLYPSIRFALYVINVQGSGTVASDLTSAIGNLPEGYLSPLHLSGIWPPGVGYREQLTRDWSALGNGLMFLVLLQFFLISKVSHRGIAFLATLAIPCLATTVFINSPYVHFKYYSFLVPGFLVVSAAGLNEVRNTLARKYSLVKNLVDPSHFKIPDLGKNNKMGMSPLGTRRSLLRRRGETKYTGKNKGRVSVQSSKSYFPKNEGAINNQLYIPFFREFCCPSSIFTPLALSALIGFEAVCVFYPLPTATIIPSLAEGSFASFEGLWKAVEGKRTMVLTKEDWLQYGAQGDDYVPLVLYIPQRFNNEPLDAVVVDRAYKADSLEYLKQFPKLLSLVEEGKCMTPYFDRFEVYLPSCTVAIPLNR